MIKIFKKSKIGVRNENEKVGNLLWLVNYSAHIIKDKSVLSVTVRKGHCLSKSWVHISIKFNRMLKSRRKFLITLELAINILSYVRYVNSKLNNNILYCKYKFILINASMTEQ